MTHNPPQRRQPASGQRRPMDDQRPQQPDRSRRLLGRFHVYGDFWYRIHLFGVRHAPAVTYYLLIPLFVAFFQLTLKRIRRAIQSNLEAVLGPCGFIEGQRRVWRLLINYAWCLTERYELLASGREVTPSYDQGYYDHWLDLLHGPTGFIMVTAHIGHWEVGSPSLETRQMHIVREAEIDSRSHRFFEDLLHERLPDGYTVHFANRRGDLGPKLLLALRDGHIVALQGDRSAKGGRTLDVELFGRPFRVPVGPAAMARSAEVPILPVFIYRSGRSASQVVVRPPIQPRRTDDRQGDLQWLAERIVSEAERAIRADPYQWFCFEELWPQPGTRT